MGWGKLLRYVVLGIPVGVTLIDYFGYVARVEGVSMQPALNPDIKENDYVFLSYRAVRNYEVERGDIVCLASPRNPEQRIIKRVIGIEGDIIRTLSYKKAFVRVPEGHCWVEGDHRGQSMDSNFFGPVPLGLVTSKASHIVWPLKRWTELKRELPSGRAPASLSEDESDFVSDVDNDGMHELVVGNQAGELSIFKGSASKPWRRALDLGMVTAVGIGDIFNSGSNSLVVINGEGWCYVFDFSNILEPNESVLKPVHVQRIPANVKVLLLSDVNADGLVELVIALTDRVVRTYQWAPAPSSRLVAINKWEFANQIGTVTVNNMANGVPSLLVAHPGGTFIRVKCRPVGSAGSDKKEEEEFLSKMSIDYHPLASSHMRNPNVSTEILGNISQGRYTSSRSGSLYAVATLDGTLMLVQDEQILWNIQVDHQLFSLSKLDITGDDREEVIACSWDGQTYIINQERQSVRFQFDYPVSTFCAGYFSLSSEDFSPSPVFVYATFHNKIYVYHDFGLRRITLQSLGDVMEDLEQVPEVFRNLGKNPQQQRELVASVLYGE